MGDNSDVDESGNDGGAVIDEDTGLASTITMSWFTLIVLLTLIYVYYVNYDHVNDLIVQHVDVKCTGQEQQPHPCLWRMA